MKVQQFLKRKAMSLLPNTIQGFLVGLRTLAIEYGYLRSIREQACVDKDGAPIPWYTYPSIEYLKQIDFTSTRVFEFGSGNSTLFWSKISEHVVSVEHDPEWYNGVLDKIDDNVEYKLCREKSTYLDSISEFDAFDIIVIDGLYRDQCAKQAIGKLKPDGLIILDNADWWVETAKFLRAHDLIQIDFWGPGPIVPYTWCTSFFFSRSYLWQPKFTHQPACGVGRLKQFADERF